jgi:hypothetical protein
VQDLVSGGWLRTATFLFGKNYFTIEMARYRKEEILCAETRELNIISKTAFLESIKKLKKRASKCIDQEEMYFEE